MPMLHVNNIATLEPSP